MRNRIRPIAFVGFGAVLAVGLSTGLGNTAKAGDHCGAHQVYYGHPCSSRHGCGSDHRYPRYDHGYRRPSRSDSYGPTYYGGYDYHDGNFQAPVPTPRAARVPAPTYRALEAPTPGDLPPSDSLPPDFTPPGVRPSRPVSSGPESSGPESSGPESSGPVSPDTAPPTPAPAAGETPRLKAAARQTVDFERDVRPILARHCFECHGSETQESGLRLDARQSALQGGRSGRAAIVPGKSAQSRLIQVITGRDRLQMPPDGSRLAANEVQTLRRWIDNGAH
jgi:Planctomycete cytochrome C